MGEMNIEITECMIHYLCLKDDYLRSSLFYAILFIEYVRFVYFLGCDHLGEQCSR